MGKAEIETTLQIVLLWPIAEIPISSADVRFRGFHGQRLKNAYLVVFSEASGFVPHPVPQPRGALRFMGVLKRSEEVAPAAIGIAGGSRFRRVALLAKSAIRGQCTLFPQKRILAVQNGSSAMGHKRT